MPSASWSPPASAQAADPEEIEGNPTCEELGFDFGFRIEATGELPTEGTHDDPDSDLE